MKKIATLVWLSGILCVVSAGALKAGSEDLSGAANDSAIAVQATSLESARNLSGKFADGSMTLQMPTPVYASQTGSATTERAPLTLTDSKKVKLAGDVPPPAPTPAPANPPAVNPDFQKPGFLNSLVEAPLAVIFTPVTGAASGGTFGWEYGKARAGKAGGVIGAIIGGAIGLAVGLVTGVVKGVINLVKAFCHLFHGRL